MFFFSLSKNFLILTEIVFLNKELSHRLKIKVLINGLSAC
jgi:hypothetical protein